MVVGVLIPLPPTFFAISASSSPFTSLDMNKAVLRSTMDPHTFAPVASTKFSHSVTGTTTFAVPQVTALILFSHNSSTDPLNAAPPHSVMIASTSAASASTNSGAPWRIITSVAFDPNHVISWGFMLACEVIFLIGAHKDLTSENVYATFFETPAG